MQVYDGDKGDQVSLDITGADARGFSVSNTGNIFIRDLKYINKTDAHIVIVAEDSGRQNDSSWLPLLIIFAGIPPRRASVPVVIKFDASSSLSSGILILLSDWSFLIDTHL